MSLATRILLVDDVIISIWLQKLSSVALSDRTTDSSCRTQRRAVLLLVSDGKISGEGTWDRTTIILQRCHVCICIYPPCSHHYIYVCVCLYVCTVVSAHARLTKRSIIEQWTCKVSEPWRYFFHRYFDVEWTEVPNKSVVRDSDADNGNWHYRGGQRSLWKKFASGWWFNAIKPVAKGLFGTGFQMRLIRLTNALVGFRSILRTIVTPNYHPDSVSWIIDSSLQVKGEVAPRSTCLR